MLRRREETLKKVLMTMLREDGLETPLNEYRAQQAWYDVMGHFTARYTASVSVQGGVMQVALTNAALRQELMMNRTAIIMRINNSVGAQVIQQLIIR
ncbi:MAG: DUF721 domain-containing protein [Bacteroidales bacterium]|nr:DUF721 domain-containing protein [Candidatus Physcousia equi]